MAQFGCSIYMNSISKMISSRNGPILRLMSTNGLPNLQMVAPFSTSNRVVNQDRKLESELTSLEYKGFLRSVKPYNPPLNVESEINKLCKDIIPPGIGSASLREFKLEDHTIRFKLLSCCIKHFNHDISNSQLHKIKTIDDLITYFEMPVKTTTRYQDFSHADLPPNLHVQQEYIRFNPETDTAFRGLTAFNKSSTIVSGLKYKKKYKGYKIPDNSVYYFEMRRKRH